MKTRDEFIADAAMRMLSANPCMTIRDTAASACALAIEMSDRGVRFAISCTNGTFMGEPFDDWHQIMDLLDARRLSCDTTYAATLRRLLGVT